MNVLKKLQEVKHNKPYYGFTKLSIGYHKIECFRFVKNIFSKKGAKDAMSVLVELKNEVVFLPQHLSQNITETDLQELNSCDENMYLHCVFIFWWS